MESKCVQYGLPTDYFFPIPFSGRPKKGAENNTHVVQSEIAKFCNGTNDGIVCQYKQQCFEMGLHNNEPGVWGGTTEAERDVFRSKIRKGNTISYQLPTEETG
jgi:hypothetical protein